MRGHTLVETLVALGLVALLVLLVWDLLPTGFAATRQAGREAQAEALVAGLLEEYRAKPFEDLEPGTVRPEPIEAGGGRGAPVVRNPRGAGGARGGRAGHAGVEVSWTWQGRSRTARAGVDLVDLPR